MSRSSSLNRALALLVAGAFFMETLDGTIIQTAAPAMARDFSVHAADINLAMTSYLLTLAVGIPVSGWLADRYGVRRIFCVAIVVFTVASALCAASGTLPVLCGMRVLQGAGGAMMVPVGRLAVLRSVQKRDLLDAMAYLTWPALVAPVIAPALGGVLVDFLNWHWIFLINIPLGVAAFIVALRVMRDTGERLTHGLDWTGFLLVGVCLAALVLGMEGIGSSPAEWIVPVLLLAASAAAGLLAVLRIRRAAHPLLDLRPLRIVTFRVGNVGGGVYRMLIGAAPFLFTLLFQVGFGWSAVTAGALVVAVFVGNVVIKPVTTPLIRLLGFRLVILGSALCGAVVFGLCALIVPSTPVPVIVVALFFSGVFRSIGFSGYNSLQFADVPPALTSGANTLASTMQQVATGLGVAVAALVVRLTTMAAGMFDAAPSAGYRWSFLVLAAVMLFPIVESFRMPPRAGAEASARRPRVPTAPRR